MTRKRLDWSLWQVFKSSGVAKWLGRVKHKKEGKSADSKGVSISENDEEEFFVPYMPEGSNTEKG